MSNTETQEPDSGEGEPQCEEQQAADEQTPNDAPQGSDTEEAASVAEELQRGAIRIVNEPSAIVPSARIVSGLFSRSTGLPIRVHSKVLGVDPLQLVDTLMAVVAIRSPQQGRGYNQQRHGDRRISGGVFDTSFLNAFVESGLDHLGSGSNSKLRYGIYGVDRAGDFKLRVARSANQELGHSPVERAAKNLMTAMACHPGVVPGTYRLEKDMPQATWGAPEGGGDLDENTVNQLLRRAGLFNDAMGVPSMEALGMDRFHERDTREGEEFFDMAEGLMVGEELFDEGRSTLEPITVRAAFDPVTIAYLYSEEGGKRDKVLDLAKDKLHKMSVSPGTYREFIFGKLASGLRDRGSRVMPMFREACLAAGRMWAQGATKDMAIAEMNSRQGQLLDAVNIHLAEGIEPKLVSDAFARASNRKGSNLDLERIHKVLAYNAADGFTMPDAKLYQRRKHPHLKANGGSVRLTSDEEAFIADAARFGDQATADLGDAIKAYQSFVVERDPSGRSVFLYTAGDGHSEEVVKGLGTDPTFRLVDGPPIQVVDYDRGGFIEEDLLDYCVPPSKG